MKKVDVYCVTLSPHDNLEVLKELPNSTLYKNDILNKLQKFIFIDNEYIKILELDDTEVFLEKRKNHKPPCKNGEDIYFQSKLTIFKVYDIQNVTYKGSGFVEFYSNNFEIEEIHTESAWKHESRRYKLM